MCSTLKVLHGDDLTRNLKYRGQSVVISKFGIRTKFRTVRYAILHFVQPGDPCDSKRLFRESSPKE